MRDGGVWTIMASTQVLVFAFLIGVFGGLRSLTAPAVTAWAARLGWLKLTSPLAWLGSLPAVIVFTLAALAELVSDKLPKTPSGAIVGAIGGVAGGFGGYQVRSRLVKALGTSKYVVAVLEDLVAIGGSLW